MTDNGLHLGDVIDSIRRHKTLIIVITIVASVSGAAFYLAGPKKFEGKTEFILRNPLYGDRNNLYNYDTKFIDYFANEDDIDRLILMSEADIVQSKVIRNLNLAKEYAIDVSNRKGEEQLARKFSKSYNITRTEYKDLVLSYTDVDPERAAKVANESVAVLDSVFSAYYKDMRQGMYQSIVDKVHEEDSSINALTDTLTNLRALYGINDIISPSRNNLMLSSMKESGKPNYGRGVELIQNTESLKDQLVADRAKQTTLVNQYKTGIRIDQMPMIKVVTVAKTPVSPKGIGGMYTVLACAFLGFFFSTMLMSLSDRYFGKTLGS
jgi:capsular polysaccharide biosynthesis protein